MPIALVLVEQATGESVFETPAVDHRSAAERRWEEPRADL